MNLFETRLRFAIFARWGAITAMLFGFLLRNILVFSIASAAYVLAQIFFPARLYTLRPRDRFGHWTVNAGATLAVVSFLVDDVSFWNEETRSTVELWSRSLGVTMAWLGIIRLEFLYYRDVPDRLLARNRLTRHLAGPE